jgi:hypothetical protein
VDELGFEEWIDGQERWSSSDDALLDLLTFRVGLTRGRIFSVRSTRHPDQHTGSENGVEELQFVSRRRGMQVSLLVTVWSNVEHAILGQNRRRESSSRRLALKIIMM